MAPESAGFRDTRAQDIALRATTASGKPWLRWGLWLAAAVALGLLARPVWRFMGADATASRATLRFATVESGAITSEASAYGRVVAAQAPMLYAATAGTVVFKVEAGAKVAAGQVLAEVDSPELRSRLGQEQQALEAAQAEADRQRVANRRAELTKQGEVEAARIARTTAQREKQRADRAWKLQAMSEVDHLRAGDALQAAEVAFALAEQDLALERESLALDLRNRLSVVQRQKLAVDEVARQVEALAIRAPFAGVVGTRLVADRTSVAANTGVLSVVDLGQLELEVPMPEIYAGAMTSGLDVGLEHAGQVYPGTVRTVSPEIVAGQFTLRIAFGDPMPPDLKQSQRVLARVQLESKANTLIVARGAFVDTEGGRYIWKVDGDQILRTPVELGALAATQVEILKGVAAGDRVVISAVPNADGQTRMLLLD